MEPDQVLTELAARQYGVVSRAQAIGAGLSPAGISRRVANGRLRQLHREVYSVSGAPVSWHQTLMAAVLWAGPGSAASHRSAARLLKLDGSWDELEITTPRRLESSTVKAHRMPAIEIRDLKTVDGIPCTGIDRTLVDLSAVLAIDPLEDALDAALRKRLTSVSRLNLRVRQEAGKRGMKKLRSLLSERSNDGHPSESRFETRLNRLFLNGGLPALRQHTVWDGGEFVARVDFCYPEAKLIVEADSYRWHSSRRAWQRDMARRNQLTALGWQIVHITWEDLVKRPAATTERIRSLVQPQLFGSANG